LEGIGLRQKCRDFYTKGANRIRELPGRPAFAIFSARWNNKESFDEVLKVAPAEVLAAAGLRLPPPADLRPAMALGVAGFLTEAQENWRAERVLIIGPVPEFRHPVPECLARADHRGLDRDVCSMPRERVERRRRETMITLDYLAAQFPNVRVIDPIDLFCDERLCRPYDSGGPLYTDGDHLSVRGAEKLYAAFSKDFAWAIEGNAATVSEVSENARGSAAGSAASP
ncbi:MAG TPA: SGNH hydrolase domain-containing protein, partial [Bauldia sp.]|nr:SGNH hydrolase domain-containing protein [Bauldia sp.]